MRIAILVTALFLPVAAVAQTEVSGKHCIVKLPFDNRPFAEEVAKFYDRALEARQFLEPDRKHAGRFHVEFFDDPSDHADAVSRAKERDESRSSSLRGTNANVYTSPSTALLFLKTGIPSPEKCRRCGLTGRTAGAVIDSAAGIGSGSMFLPSWLRSGFEAFYKARIVGALDENARSRNPMLSPGQVAVHRAARDGSLPSVRKLEDYGPSFESHYTGCARELFFMLMRRHEVEFRAFLVSLRDQGFLDRKSKIADLKRLLPDGTDLEKEFREHCGRLSPEWDGLGGLFMASYSGPRNRLVLDGSSFLSMLYTAQPTRSDDYTIAGRFEFFGDGDGMATINFHAPAKDRNRSPPMIAAVSFWRDGRVFVRGGQGQRATGENTGGRGPAFVAGKAQPFRVNVKGEDITVELAGRKIAEGRVDADLSQLWGVSSSMKTTVIVHDLRCENPGLLAACLKNLSNPATAVEARAVLQRDPLAAVPVLVKRLGASPYADGAELDPALDIARGMHEHAGELLPGVWEYLKKCDGRQAMRVLDVLTEVAQRAPRSAQRQLSREPLLGDPTRRGVDQVAWQSRCTELKYRLSIDAKAPVAQLVRELKKGRVFAREAAAAALGARGEAASAAVPALLAALRKGKSPGSDATIEVGGKKVVLRDRFLEATREALLAIAPGDRRLHPIYVEVLRKSKKPDARIAAAQGLGSMGPKVPRAAVTAMIKTFKSERNEQVKLALIRAFAEMGPAARSAVYHLKRLARETGSDELKTAAATAVARIEG